MIGFGVAFVVGVISGVVVYLITAANLRPNLVFEPQVGEIFGPHPHTASRRYRILHVRVINQRRAWWQRWRDKTGSYARCFVEYKDAASGDVILRESGRWASGPEPLVGTQPNIPAIVIPQREILVVGEDFSIDIALKYEGHAHFYAFNNRSYLPSDDDVTLAWTHKDKRLEQDVLHVQVEIWAEGLKVRSRDFILRNPNTSLENFAIADT